LQADAGMQVAASNGTLRQAKQYAQYCCVKDKKIARDPKATRY